VKVDVDNFAWDAQVAPSVNSSIKIYENNKLQFGIDDVRIERTMGVDPQEGRIFTIKSRLYSLLHHTVKDLKTGKAYENFNPGEINMGFDSQSRTWNLNVSSGDLDITTDGQTSNATCSVTRKVSRLYWASRYSSIYIWKEDDQYAMNNPWDKIDFPSKNRAN
jgi:hypothetical protein